MAVGKGPEEPLHNTWQAAKQRAYSFNLLSFGVPWANVLSRLHAFIGHPLSL